MNVRTEPEIPQEHGQLLRPERLADLIGCSARTLRRMVADGAVPPPLRLGRLRRWREADIYDWMAGQRSIAARSSDPEVSRE